MEPRGFVVARAVHQSVPRTLKVVPAEDEDFERGAPGTLVDGEFVEATSPNPSGITHVAKHGVGPSDGNFGTTLLNRREFPPHEVLVTDVTETTFRARFEGDLPEETGGTYGAKKLADGSWVVDFDADEDTVRYLGPVSDLPGQSDDEDHLPAWHLYEVEVEFVAAEAGGGGGD